MRDWNAEIRRRLAPLPISPAREAEIADELGQHLEDRYQELRGRGAGDAEALAMVLEELGDAGALARALRATERRDDAGPLPLGGGPRLGLSQLGRDLRHGIRALLTRPGFTAVAVLTLALGIGATVGIFSVVRTVLLKPLPFREPDRLVTYWGTAPEKGLPEVDMPMGLYVAQRDQNRVFEDLAAYWRIGLTLTGAWDPQRLDGAIITWNFFRTLGREPLLGRTFLPDEDVPNGPSVVILSHALWRSRFGGDSGIVGRTITLNDSAAQVVGVMPSDVEFPYRPDMWVPLQIDANRFNCWCFSLVGRLKPGFTAADAKSDMERVTDAFARERRDVFPEGAGAGSVFVVKSLSSRLVERVRPPLLTLQGAVVLVLLIACSNVANLLLARAAARRREMAVRCCLGATPSRIAAQLFTESLLLALAGAAAGPALAYAGVGLIRRGWSAQIPRLDQAAVDLPVLAFTVVVAVLSALLFGLVPALRGSRVDLQDSLKDGARGSSGSSRRLSSAFVTAQFALSLMLLTGAGLLLRSFGRLLAVDPGFRAEHVLAARIQLPFPRYANDTMVRGFYDQLTARVAAQPGVSAVGLASRVPFGRGNPQDNVEAEGKPSLPGQPVKVANIRYVTPRYFAAIGTPLLRGRGFDAGDAGSSLRVAVVDEALANHFWRGEDPIGKRLRHGGDTSATAWMTVVGVVPNVKHASLDEDESLQLYEAQAQNTNWTMYLVVRAATAPEPLAAAIRAQLRELDSSLPLYEVQTMEQALSASLATRRLTNTLLAAFAASALLLAAIGIYGVVALGVNGRLREFGVRLALGARPGEVLGLVLRHGLLLALGGVIAGLAGAAAFTGLLRELLFGISPFDPLTFGAVAAILAAAALLACWLPARRAAHADPLFALRSE